jgi:hypothetical protein
MPSPEDCGLLAGLLEAVEGARAEAYREWGAYRLERLAGLHNLDLLARFRRQQMSWASALQTAFQAEVVPADLLATVQAKAAAMQRGWTALAAWAAEAGHRPAAPWVWETMLADGSIVALVQDDAGAAKVIADGRDVSVWTVREVANLIDAATDALKLERTHMPGAKFKAADVGNPLGAPEWSDAGDAIPFGEAQA